MQMLNLHLLLALPRSFMHEIDRIVQDHIISDLDDSVDQSKLYRQQNYDRLCFNIPFPKSLPSLISSQNS